MKCILVMAALIGNTPADFEGVGYVERLESGHREYLKQVGRNVAIQRERGMDINDWDREVEILSIDGDLARIDAGYVMLSQLECGRGPQKQ